jgi:hypothetical protein
LLQNLLYGIKGKLIGKFDILYTGFIFGKNNNRNFATTKSQMIYSIGGQGQCTSMVLGKQLCWGSMCPVVETF